MKRISTFLLVVSALQVWAQPTPIPVGSILAQGQTPAHDPVMIQQGETYYMFCTGFGISVFSSKDMKRWRKEKSVFDKAPEWAVKAVPGFRGHIWAPDISYHNGLYYLYYAVSAFGKNTSCIGVAVNKTLDSASKDFKWEDKGKVIQSVPNRDMWNAIDANLIIDEKGIPWLNFGSFWDGIKMVKLNSDLLSVAEPQEWYSLASRKRDFSLADSLAGNAAIEAPFIFKKNKYYYLFVSFDYCCRAEKSDYKIMVGRSEKVSGPYLDKQGTNMVWGGGSLVQQGDSIWYGVGHNAAYNFDGKDYIIFHGYDASDKGKSKLIIEELKWDKDGWPVTNN